jgi:hypothetical protein
METVRLAREPTIDALTRRDRVLTVATPAIAGLVVWIVARLLGQDLTTTQAGSDGLTTIGPVIVVATSLVFGLIAWSVLALLEWLTHRARRTWTVPGPVVLLLSLAGPLTRAGGPATAIALLSEHLVVGGVLIAGLLRTSPSRRP